jgi:hypothetical protein
MSSTDAAPPVQTDSAESAGVDGPSFNGCVDITGEVAANAGADAKFFSLFDAGTKVPIFDKQFDLFKVSSYSGQIASLSKPT